MWPDDSGSWSPANWLDDTGTTAQNGPSAVSTDVLTGSTQGGASTAPTDKWSGFFQNLIGDTVKYAVQKDAVKSGLQKTTAANGQPVYTASAPVSGSMNSTYLVLGGLALLVVVVGLSSSKG